MKPLTAFSLRAERVAFTLGAVLAVLIVVHVLAMQANFNPALGLKERFGFHYWQLAFFDLDEEESFGTWFNSGILLIAGVLLLSQARALQARGAAWHRSWQVLGILFLALSVDEIAGMHEFRRNDRRPRSTVTAEVSTHGSEWTYEVLPLFCPSCRGSGFRQAVIIVNNGLWKGLGGTSPGFSEVSTAHYERLALSPASVSATAGRPQTQLQSRLRENVAVAGIQRSRSSLSISKCSSIA